MKTSWPAVTTLLAGLEVLTALPVSDAVVTGTAGGCVVVVVTGGGGMVVVVVDGAGGSAGGAVVVVVGGTVVVVVPPLSPGAAFMKIIVTHINPLSSVVTPTPM